MPYFIQFTWESGVINELGPIVPDNHKSVYGLEDRRIKNSCDRLSKSINKMSGDVVCKVIHRVNREVMSERYIN